MEKSYFWWILHSFKYEYCLHKTDIIMFQMMGKDVSLPVRVDRELSVSSLMLYVFLVPKAQLNNILK